MSVHDFHLNFTLKGETFDCYLHEQSATEESVVLNGHTYSLEGTGCDQLRKMIPEFP